MTDTWLSAAAERPLVIAHRGASRRAPENTMAAFAAAIEIGCDAVEMDVRRTSDGALVVHHAAQRRGTPLAQLTYAQLARRARHVPPRLEEVATLCAGRIAMDVELKEEGSEHAAVELLARRFPRDRLLITSFHDSVIATVKQLDSGLACGLLVPPAALQSPRRRRAENAVDRALRCGADLLLPHQLLVPVRGTMLRRRERSGVVSAAARHGLPAIVWTVNGARRMERYLAEPDIAGIITDLPDIASRLALRAPRAPIATLS